MNIESQISALSEAVELLQKSVSCSICLEIMVNPTRTKCGHSFCHDCIMTVISKNRMASCPLCNSKINRRTVKENEKAKILVERVTDVINSIGKDLGMDIVAHARIPKSTHEALLKSPQVQRVLRQSKLEPETVWQKSDLKCKSKYEKQENKEKQQEKNSGLVSKNHLSPSSPNEKEGSKEKEQVKTPELISISQVLPLSPPATDEKVPYSIPKNVEVVPRKKKVEEWLDKEFDTETSIETEDKEKSEQVTVVADVHKTEAEDVKSAPRQRLRSYKISNKKLMVFTDVDKITVDNEAEENNKKRKVENEEQNAEVAGNLESDPYTFISSQKTPVKSTRKSWRQKEKENKSASASNKVEMQKKKPKTVAAKPLPVRYNESQTLSLDIYDTFDKLVATANKTEPHTSKEEHSDSDDTVFLFKSPLKGNSSASEDPCDLDVHLSLGEADIIRKHEGSEGYEKMPDKQCNSKAVGRRRTRSKSAGTSKPSVKPETGSRNIKQMFEESKANMTIPLSPSKKINQTVDGISLADGAITNIPAIKSLILDEAIKQEMQVLEKENLIDVIESATPVNISKLNSTVGTKSPGWSRISKSKKEFDKLKKRECVALNVSGGVATKRNKITDSFRKVSSDTLPEPMLPLAEDTQNAVDIPISAVKPIADDSPKTENLNPVEATEDRLPQKTPGENNFPKPDVSLLSKKSFTDSFSDIDVLDSPTSCKRKIHIKSLIAFLNSENEASKAAETISPKDLEVPGLTINDLDELELKKQSVQLKNENAGLNTEPQQEVGVNDQEASSETTLSHKNKEGAKETSEVVKDNQLSHSDIAMKKQTENKEPQTSQNLDSCILKNTEECREKNKRNVIFVKRGRFSHLTKHIPFILFGKLTSRKRSYSEIREEYMVKSDELKHSSQENKVVIPSETLKSTASACIQTSPTLMHPSPEKRTLEFVGAEESQGCNFVAGSSDTIDFPSIIPLPHKKSAAILREHAACFCPSQTDNIPTQEFHPPPPAKKPNTSYKTDNEEQKPRSNSGSKMTLSQFSNATTVKYDRSGRGSPENSLETCNYSPDLSLSLLEVDNPDAFKDNDVSVSKKLSNEVSSGNDSDIRIPFKGKTVNRRLNFVPELTDPALDISAEMQAEDTKKPFKRIRSPSSSDSDSETLVPQISDSHSSGSKRVKHNEEEDVEIVNLISSQENDGKSVSESDIPNSAEVNARIMANIEADLAVKRNRTNSDCGESDMEEERSTVMFTPTEYFGSQIGNSCSTDFHPNSAASSEAIILGTLQQENEFKIKPKTPTGDKIGVEVNRSPQGPPAVNKTSDGDCESDDGFVQPTPSKDDSANPRNAKASWVPSELRSMSIGVLQDVLKEPKDLPEHSETAETVEKTSSHKTDVKSALMNRLSTNRVTSSVSVEKPNSVKQLKENTPKITTERDPLQRPGFGERPTGDSSSTSVRTVSKTPETSKKAQVKPCFVCSGLPPSMIAQVKSLASMVNAEFSNTFTPNTTHLILKDAEDNLAYKTLKYLYAVVNKTWVVSFSWVSNCLREQKLLPEDDYEMLDSSGENGPYRARISKDLLLGNFEFCCVEPYTDITKDQLEELLKECGAYLVNSPAEIKFRSGIHNMILVQMEAKTEEEVQYWWDKYGVITVAHEWVLDSIGRYRVIPIWPYLMTDIEEEHLQALGYPDELLATDELEPESQATVS